MRVRTWATFAAASPDDQVGQGRDLRPIEGGDVGQAIADMLTHLGAAVFTEVALEGRWTFFVVFNEHPFFCRIISLHPEFVLRLDEVPVRWSPKKPAIHAELAVKLTHELAQDSRFRDLLWYAHQYGPDGSGTEDPLTPPPRTRGSGVRQLKLVLRGLGWLLLLLAALAILDPLSNGRVVGAVYLVAAAFLLSIGYRIRRVFGLRLPWVRDERKAEPSVPAGPE